ncbi:MAG: hypothetical protein A3K19_19010 [Lentisphaerae bacterium RIFOXYB12_FULL_65_16]|nr:MAG: hypothetical protein A3K18_17540 [Lentisphaerae bacterium RIFOXYA12_64_32]OGV86863.1 MAG: hypothetical protein A3K19_19010 [Lentisphaerae bacterium RIFOXYB12_FULL_65_16]
MKFRRSSGLAPQFSGYPLVVFCLPLLLVLLASAWAPAQEQPRKLSLTLSPINTQTVEDPKDKSKATTHRQSATFPLGPATYTISYYAKFAEGDSSKMLGTEGAIGMPAPTSCNWYHSGFLFIELNGVDIAATSFIHSMTVSEIGQRGILDMVWQHELADVRIRFLGLPDADHLPCEITLEPKTELTSIKVHARCYPSFFTSWHKRQGARRIQTPATLVKEGEKATVPAKDNGWAVFYDEVFDVAKGEGEGPCAMLLLPEEGQEISFVPTGYPVETYITFPPATRTIRMAFWDFKGKTNADALERLRTGAEAVRQALQTADFTPQPVRSFDANLFRTELEKALQSAAVKELLGAKTAEVQAWFDANKTSFQPGAGPMPIRMQEELLQSVEKLNSFIWEVRLAELVSEL